jgi:hypothetical protein
MVWQKEGDLRRKEPKQRSGNEGDGYGGRNDKWVDET